MPKCPADHRVIIPFNQSDKEMKLPAIPRVDFGLYADTRSGSERTIAKPSNDFDIVYSRHKESWFVTRSYLFPNIQDKLATFGQHCYYRPKETLLLVFDKFDVAMMAHLALPTSVLLQENWWDIFHGAEYRHDPIFREIKTSSSGLIRISGEQADMSVQNVVEVHSHQTNGHFFPAVSGTLLRIHGKRSLSSTMFRMFVIPIMAVTFLGT